MNNVPFKIIPDNKAAVKAEVPPPFKIIPDNKAAVKAEVLPPFKIIPDNKAVVKAEVPVPFKIDPRFVMDQQHGIKVQSAHDHKKKEFHDRNMIPISIPDVCNHHTEDTGMKEMVTNVIFDNNNQYDESEFSFTFSIIGRLYEFKSPTKYTDYLIVEIKHILARDTIITIEADKYYKGLAAVIHAKCPHCQIDEEEFPRIVSKEYIKYEKSNTKKITYKFNFGGWFKFPKEFSNQENQKLRFLHNGIDGVDCDYILIRDIDKARRFVDMFLQLSDSKSKIILCLIFMVYAPLARLFYEADRRASGLNAVLFISAYTGTGKTTLSSIIAKSILHDNAKAYARFEDTLPSLIEQALNRNDAPILIDDYYSMTSSAEQKLQQEKLDVITRMVGDGMARTVLGPDRKPVEDRDYYGTVIMTGEFRNLRNQSSYLRNWRNHISKGELKLGPEYGPDSPGSILRQDNSFAKAFMSEWIAFLEYNQDLIKRDLPLICSQAHEDARTSVPKSEHARFYSNVSAMLSTAKLLGIFLESIHFEDILNYKVLKEAICKEAINQVETLKEVDPITIFIKSIVDAIENSRITILPDKNTFKCYEGGGYYDEVSETDATGDHMIKVVCIMSKVVSDIIDTYAKEQQYGVKLTRAVLENLVHKDIIIPNGTEFTHKFKSKRTVAPTRPTMYIIKRGGLFCE